MFIKWLKEELFFIPLLTSLFCFIGVYLLIKLGFNMMTSTNEMYARTSVGAWLITITIFLIALFFGYFSFYLWRQISLRKKIVLILNAYEKPLSVAAFGLSFLLLAVLLIADNKNTFLPIFIVRISPLLQYIFWVSFLFLLFGHVLFFSNRWKILKQQWGLEVGGMKLWLGWLIGLLFFSFLFYLIFEVFVPWLTNEPWVPKTSVPMTGLHLFLILMIVLIYFLFHRLIPIRYRNAIVMVLLWAGSVALWSLQPMSESYFVRKPFPPNEQLVPFSDARVYDKAAQFILIGEGHTAIKSSPRPVYESYLAFLHLIAGQDYEKVIFLQVMLVGLLPVLIYLMGKYIHSSAAGLVTALLFIFKQSSGMIVEKYFYTVHVRLMMTEILAMVGFVFGSYLFMNYLQSQNKDKKQLLWVGAIFGLTFLVRPGALFPFLACIVLMSCVYWLSLKKNAASFLLLIVGFFVVILPWTIRTQITKGTPNFISGKVGVVLNRWGLGDDNSATAQVEREESENEKGSKNDGINKLLIKAPSFFYTNLRSTVFALPSSITYYDSKNIISDLIKEFDEGITTFIPRTTFFLGVNLLILALGFAYAWRSSRWVGMVPLFIFLSYHLVNSLGHLTGARHAVPVDWALLFYYGIGLVQLFGWLWVFIWGTTLRIQKDFSEINVSVTEIFHWRSIFVTVILIGLVGSSMPVFELLFEKKYQPVAVAGKIVSADVVMRLEKVGISQEEAEQFLKSDSSAVILQGGLLYPSFGDKKTYDSKYLTDFDRLNFQLFSGAFAYKAVLPRLSTTPPLPVGEPAIILGCLYAGTEKNIFTWGVIVSDPMEEVKLYTREPIAPLACPMPDVQCDESGCKNIDPLYP